MNTITASVTQFNNNADKVINQKDSEFVKEIKKNIFTLTSKMNYYSNRISSSVHIDEKEAFSEKSLILLSNDDLNHRLMQMNFNKSEADRISQASHNLMNIKANLKAKEYRINLADTDDLQMLKDFHTNVNICHDLQLKAFKEAYNLAVK